jgi:hypothetical protein
MANGADGPRRFNCDIDKSLKFCLFTGKSRRMPRICGLGHHTFGWIFGKSHSNYKVEWRVDALPALNHCCRRVRQDSL